MPVTPIFLLRSFHPFHTLQVAELSQTLWSTLTFAVTAVPLFKHCSSQVLGASRPTHVIAM